MTKNSKNAQDDGTFHGGLVRNRGEGRGVRIARAKVDELPTVSGEDAQVRALQLQANKRPNSFPNGPSELKARSTKLACLGIPSSVLDVGDREYARCVRLASAYKKARQKELYIAHGHVSSGVGALLAAASLALSASRFLYELASKTPVQPEEKGLLGMPTILKLASSLSDSARQNELSAWELCSREAVIHKRNANNNQQVPWILSDNRYQETGKEVAKAGRPRKVQVALGMAGGNSAPKMCDHSSCSAAVEDSEDFCQWHSRKIINARDYGQTEGGRGLGEQEPAGQVAGESPGGPNGPGHSGQGGPGDP